jgi:hypothetical protein
MTESSPFSEVETDDGETVEVYDGEPDEVDRAKGGVQDIVEGDEVEGGEPS